MRQINMDTSNSKLKNLKEEIVLACMFIDQKKADQVSWTNEKFECSVTISGGDDNVKISFGDYNMNPNKNAKLIAKKLLGKPDKEYSRKSVLTEGLYIHYMVWNNSLLH